MSSFSLDPKQHFLRAGLQQVGAGSGQQTGAGAGSGQHFGAGQHFETRGLLQQQSNRPACVFSVATTKVIAATRANTNLFIWGSLN